MNEKLSDGLIQISNLLMVAHDKGERVRLAGMLNSIILQAMDMERAEECIVPREKALSADIKFTKKEVDSMSKTFKKEFIANGCVAHIIKRQSGKNGFYYEIRYRRNGYNITVSNKDLSIAKALFIDKTHRLGKPEKNRNSRTRFGNVINEWLRYKEGKIADRTWKNYLSHAEKNIPTEMKEKQIEKIGTGEIDDLMRTFAPRMYEEMRVLFNSVFKFAKASGIITHNPVELIPFKRAKRQNRDKLSSEQIHNYLQNLQKSKFEVVRNVGYVLYFFGLRPCEIDEEAHFENGFLICRNRKRHNGEIAYKKIPIPQVAYGFIDFEKPICFQKSYDRCADILREALGEGLTPYNLRHTFASTCSKYVPREIVEIWMGDSPERLVGKTYVHFDDDYMKEQMKKVIFEQ